MADGWGNFYFLTGSAAAGLIGLLFVVATLTAEIEQRRAVRGVRLFMTPTVFNFSAVLALSALSTIQHPGAGVVPAAMALAALIGTAYMLRRTAELSRDGVSEDWTDIVFYGALPVAGYLALGVDAWAIWSAHAFAPLLTGGVMIGFLLLGIRNAWDLVTWIAPRIERSELNMGIDEAPADKAGAKAANKTR